LEVRDSSPDGLEETSVREQQTVVLMSLDTHHPKPLPAQLRERMSAYLAPARQAFEISVLS
jgi:hypothetical protein